MSIDTRIRLQYHKRAGDKVLPLTWAILKEAHTQEANIKELQEACQLTVDIWQEQANITPLCELRSEGKPAYERILEELGEFFNCREAEEKYLEQERERRRIWAEELCQAEKRFRAQEAAKTPEEREAEEKLWRERFRETKETDCNGAAPLAMTKDGKENA